MHKASQSNVKLWVPDRNQRCKKYGHFSQGKHSWAIIWCFMNREKSVILSTHSAYNIFYTHSDMVAFTLTYTVGSTDPGTGQIHHILNKFICLMLDLHSHTSRAQPFTIYYLSMLVLMSIHVSKRGPLAIFQNEITATWQYYIDDSKVLCTTIGGTSVHITLWYVIFSWYLTRNQK